MTMTLEPAPKVLTGKVYIRCTGKRKDGSGRTCNILLGIIAVTAFDGVLEIKCPKCDTVAEFR